MALRAFAPMALLIPALLSCKARNAQSSAVRDADTDGVAESAVPLPVLKNAFVDAHRFAYRIVSEFPKEGLPEPAPTWLLDQRSALAATIKRTKLVWLDEGTSAPACAKADWGAAREPIITLAPSKCAPFAADDVKLAKLLIHEGCHHQGETSETRCDEVADLSYAAWDWDQRTTNLGNWQLLPLTGSPLFQEKHAIWAGDRLVVFGGPKASPGDSYVASYKPGTRTWDPIPHARSTNLPFNRHIPDLPWLSAAAWNGKEIFLWGGFSGFDVRPQYTGALLDPKTKTWRPVKEAGAPMVRPGHSVVWTGKAFLVWGQAANGTAPLGGLYDPVTERWQPVSTIDAPAGRTQHVAVWTGSKMLIWGGLQGPLSPLDRNDAQRRYLGDGAAYDPATHKWTPLSAKNAPARRAFGVGVWTGRELFIWESGGQLGAANGALYNPETDSWKTVSTEVGIEVTDVGAFDSDMYARPHSAIWTGEHVILLSSKLHDLDREAAMAYDPLINRWSYLKRMPAEVLMLPLAVWTGTSMLVWGGSDVLLRDQKPQGVIWKP